MSLLIAFTIAYDLPRDCARAVPDSDGLDGTDAARRTRADVRQGDGLFVADEARSQFLDPQTQQVALPNQSVTEAREPNTNRLLPTLKTTSSSGDRIFVLKYLYPFGSPQRWDVVVFRTPTSPQEYYIKRLVGLKTKNSRSWTATCSRVHFKSDRNESADECWKSTEWKTAQAAACRTRCGN